MRQLILCVTVILGTFSVIYTHGVLAPIAPGDSVDHLAYAAVLYEIAIGQGVCHSLVGCEKTASIC